MQQTSSLVVADAPFRISVTSDEAFAHPGWQRARAAVLAVLARGGAVVLVGRPGSGKTLLLHELARTLRREGTPARLIGRGDTLEPVPTAGVLLVDDAEFVDADALAALCATATRFVLAANPDFADGLAGLPVPVAPVALDPLPLEDVARFVAARLSTMGQPRDSLEPEAVVALARHSGGLLRLVNVLGAAAMFLARLEGSSRVCLRHVEAAAMRDGTREDAEPAAPAELETATAAPSRLSEAQAVRASQPAGRQRRSVLGAVAVVLVLALAGGWAFRDRQTVQPSTAQANDSGPRNGDPFAHSPRTAAGTQPSKAPSVAGESTAGDAVDPPQQAATPRRDVQAVSPPASEPRQTALPSDAPALFRGPIINETMGRLGRVALVIRKQGVPGSVIIGFEASAGLLGSGELAGRLSEDGRITASGQLMMGSNPFICDLSGIISGDTLMGSARFTRSSSGYTAHSRFTLARS